jgi:hypothetical protein
MSPRKPIEKPRFFWVVCTDYAQGPFSTEEIAQRSLDAIETLGACSLPHEIRMTRIPGQRPKARFARY